MLRRLQSGGFSESNANLVGTRALRPSARAPVQMNLATAVRRFGGSLPGGRRRTRRWATIGGLAALAGLGALLALARQVEYGVGLDHDSANYIAAASQLQQGKPPLRHEGYAYMNAPPLYPALLAVAGLGVFDLVQVAGVLNAGLLGATILVTGALLCRRLRTHRVWAWCGCLALAVGPLAATASVALTTSAYVLFVVCALACVAVRDPPWRRLVLAAVFTAAACLTRYMGIALLALVVTVLLACSDLPWRQRSWRAAVFAAVAAIPPGLWLLRNWLLAGTLTNRSETAPIPLLDGLRLCADAVVEWTFLRLPVAAWFGSSWLPALGLLAALAGAAVALRRRRDLLHLSLVFGGFALAHLTLLALALALGQSESASYRYAVPAYAPLLVCVWLLIGGLLDRGRGRSAPAGAGAAPRPLERRRSAQTNQVRVKHGVAPANSNAPRQGAPGAWRLGRVGLAIVALAPWLVYQGALQKEDIERRNGNGFYYDGPRWRGSDAARQVATRAFPGGLYSNYTPALFFHTPHRSLTPLARSHLGGAGDYLLWFDEMPVPDIARGAPWTRAGVDVVASYADGVLLRSNATSTETLWDVVWAHFVPTEPPLASGDFEVRFDRARAAIVYTKSPCLPGDVAARFFVHVFTRRSEASPAGAGTGFDNLDFDFRERGMREPSSPARCLAVVALPDYSIARIRTGQFDRAVVWEAQIRFDSRANALPAAPPSSAPAATLRSP